MKLILFSVSFFAIGSVFGLYSRWLLDESITQTNLNSLSGETLSHLDDLGKLTRQMSPQVVEKTWKEFDEGTAALNDLYFLSEALEASARAVTYANVERLGWDGYKGTLIWDESRYLSRSAGRRDSVRSDYVKKRMREADEAIHASIPATLLANSAPYY